LSAECARKFFFKSVNNWWRYGQKESATFFYGPRCMLDKDTAICSGYLCKRSNVEFHTTLIPYHIIQEGGRWKEIIIISWRVMKYYSTTHKKQTDTLNSRDVVLGLGELGKLLQHFRLDANSIFQQNFESILKLHLYFWMFSKNFRDAGLFPGMDSTGFFLF